jgi:hypothetical protein
VKFLIMQFFFHLVGFSVLGESIPLSSFFTNTLSLYFSPNVRDPVSTHTKQSIFIVLYILILMFFG